ncbi:MAG: NAD(P)-dependent oxidoreductase [Dehalococcoidia bacterium]|nr:NAD(P)-dependent oxidoreductase [Dehalococcoidia bacterium]
MPEKLRVGFIGLGLMGRPMSLNLLKAGFPLIVWNRTQSKADSVVKAGAMLGRSPANVATRSDVVITMVSDSPDVEQVVLGSGGVPTGVIDGAQRGSVVVDMSTISPAVTRSIAQRLAEKGVAMLDAPVSGGTVGAQNATLSIMVGGDPEVLQRCMPVFQALGQRVTHCGPNGMGQVTKLVNQIIVTGTLSAVCEGLLFGAKAGADLQAVQRAVSGGAANSWQLENLGPRILSGDFAPGFMVKLLQKDLRLVDEAATEMGLPLFTTLIAQQVLRVAANLGLSDEGTQAYIKALEAMAGVQARTPSS